MVVIKRCLYNYTTESNLRASHTIATLNLNAKERSPQFSMQKQSLSCKILQDDVTPCKIFARLSFLKEEIGSKKVKKRPKMPKDPPPPRSRSYLTLRLFLERKHFSTIEGIKNDLARLTPFCKILQDYFFAIIFLDLARLTSALE